MIQDNENQDTSASGISERRTIWQRLFGKSKKSTRSRIIQITLWVLLLVVIILASVILYAIVPSDGTPGAEINYPQKWVFGWDVIKFIDKIVDWIVINWEPFFSAINIVVLRILVPLEDFFLWLPWWSIIILTGFVGWRIVSAKFAFMATIFLAILTLMGMLDYASMTLAITLTSALICVILGIPIGIIAAKSNRFDSFIRPVLDAMQTMPSFVYLIPALMLFGLGKTPAVVAVCIYAIPPIIRFTSLGIRQVDSQVVEASQAFGATSWQILTKVQVPLSLPTLLAGLNQTIMMALAMVVIASMIGAKGLGEEVLKGIARLEVGRGLIAGTGIVFMAIILDRISQGIAKKPQTGRITK